MEHLVIVAYLVSFTLIVRFSTKMARRVSKYIDEREEMHLAEMEALLEQEEAERQKQEQEQQEQERPRKKSKKVVEVPDNKSYEDAVSALVALGMKKKVAEKSVSSITKDNPQMSVDDIIRAALASNKV